MDYLARFTELARFADDYVAIDLAKVRRFENGLKLSIRARIVGLRLQDMDSMVGTALTIEREIEDARSTRDASVSGKRKDSQSSSSLGKRKRASSSRGSQSHGHLGQGQMRVVGQAGQMRVASQAGQMVCYHCQQPGHMRRDCPKRQGSQGFGTSQSQSVADQERIQFLSSTAQYRPEEPVTVSGRYTGTPPFTGRPERPEYGERQRTRPTGKDIRGPVACLRRHIAG